MFLPMMQDFHMWTLTLKNILLSFAGSSIFYILRWLYHNACAWAGFCCRPLLLLLHVLVSPQFIDQDLDLVKKNFLYLQSIFRAIRRAEDAVDSEKTPVSIWLYSTFLFSLSYGWWLKGFNVAEAAYASRDWNVCFEFSQTWKHWFVPCSWTSSSSIIAV